MARPLRSVRVPPDQPLTASLEALSRALEGRGPALAPVAGAVDPARAGATEVPDAVALAVATSGTTGAPRRVLLGADAVRASALSTHEHLGGPGTWLLALPAHHVAGLQVLVRSLVAGTTPVVLPGLGAGAGTAELMRAIAAMPDAGPRYASLVPTQVHRALADPAATLALTTLDAVLLGGSATPAPLLDAARDARIRVVRTYGMAETSGGCVYDGRPLTGVEVHLDADGRVLLAGPVLAHGYLTATGRVEPLELVAHLGRRRLRTRDTGVLEEGRLRVTGRVDDLVVTGGLKVAPGTVEDAVLAHLPGAREAAVVGVPDPEWGAVLTLVLALADDAPGSPTLHAVRAALRDHLPAHALPRALTVVPALPRRPGLEKVDRDAVARLAVAAIG